MATLKDSVWRFSRCLRALQIASTKRTPVEFPVNVYVTVARSSMRSSGSARSLGRNFAEIVECRMRCLLIH